MTKQGERQLVVLPYLGALPFLICAGILFLGWQLPIGFQAATVMSSYGLAIVCFMAGVHWGQHLSGQPSGLRLPLLSNAIVLLAWFSWLFLPHRQFFVALAVLFGILLWVDWQLLRAGRIDVAYWATRMRVTALVTGALLVGTAIV